MLHLVGSSLKQKLYPYRGETDFYDTYNLLFPILNKLSIEGKIDFGFKEIEDDANSTLANRFYILLHKNINKKDLS